MRRRARGIRSYVIPSNRTFRRRGREPRQGWSATCRVSLGCRSGKRGGICSRVRLVEARNSVRSTAAGVEELLDVSAGMPVVAKIKTALLLLMKPLSKDVVQTALELIEPPRPGTGGWHAVRSIHRICVRIYRSTVIQIGGSAATEPPPLKWQMHSRTQNSIGCRRQCSCKYMILCIGSFREHKRGFCKGHKFWTISAMQGVCGSMPRIHHAGH